jgi:dynein heavy chain
VQVAAPGGGGALDAARCRAPAAVAAFEAGHAPALFCFTDPAGQLQVAAAMPARFSKLLYLLQEPTTGATSCAVGAPALAAAGYLDGCACADPLAQLQGQLEHLHLAQLRAISAASWPEQLRGDWAGEAQAFSSAFTEAVHAPRGTTVLYVPPEDVSDPGAAARRRDLVQRLEVQLLRWTRQIRELLSRHGAREPRAGAAGQQQQQQQAEEEEGPAEEVQFWRMRTADLGSLRDQLDGAALGRVLRVLEAAKSPHLPAFLSLRGGIQAEAEQAASNLAFLAALEAPPCAALATASPEQLPAVLPAVLDALRMVWALSTHCNTPEQMTCALRQVSNAVVARCRASLDLPAISRGQNLPAAARRLEQCCTAAAAWRGLYAEAAQRASAALPQRPWAFEAAAISAHVEAFVQRCRDLQEVCAAQQQFDCGPTLTAVLGGTRAPEVARAIGEVQQAFAAQMARWVGGGRQAI